MSFLQLLAVHFVLIKDFSSIVMEDLASQTKSTKKKSVASCAKP